MAAIDGSWDTVVKSPLGDQKAVLTVKTDGATWTGSQVGAQGSAEITDGIVDGETIKWTMSIVRADADDADLRSVGGRRHADRLGRRGRIRAASR